MTDNTDLPREPPGDKREARLREQVEGLPTIPDAEFRRLSRRSFLTGAAGAVAGVGLWRWVQTQDSEGGIPNVLRDQLERNETIWSALPARFAPEYANAEAEPIRVNGTIGLEDELNLERWACRVEGPDGQLLDVLDIAAFEALQQRELVIEHKCIEGWSSIVHWGGTRFSDFHARYADRVGDVPYVGLATPDGDYYVGWDTASIMHPQTLLVLREHGGPLTTEHGAPLRLATPNKYGIKTIKRIGVIRYSQTRPADYWAERSYDWYAGL